MQMAWVIHALNKFYKHLIKLSMPDNNKDNSVELKNNRSSAAVESAVLIFKLKQHFSSSLKQ